MKKLNVIIAVFLVALTAIGWISYITTTSSDLIEYNKNIEDAEAFTDQGLYYRAIDSYAKAIEYRPSEKNWTSLLAVCVLNCGEYPSYLSNYIDYLESAVAQFPKNVDFIYELATAYYNDESYSSAYNVVLNAVENGVNDEKITTLMQELKYLYKLEGSPFYSFYSPINDTYVVQTAGGWGTMTTEGQFSSSEYPYYGPLSENGERLFTTAELGARLYNENDEVLAKFEGNVTDAGRLSEGLIAIQLDDGKYAYYNEFGKKQFGDYDAAGTFHDGKAAVQIGGKWGVIDQQGETVVDAKFDEIVLDNYGYFNNQEVVVACIDGKYSLYDDSLNKVSDFEAEDMGIPTADNKIAFCQSGKWGYIDTQGKVLIEPAYDGALSFSNGLAGVRVGDAWGFIDTDNNIVIQCEFAGVDYFNADGTCCVRVDSGIGEDTTPQWQMLVLELGL